MARRGRKRNPNARRRQTTLRDRKPLDHGTELARRRRVELVGRADPALADCALGILFARGWIDERQYKAGSLLASFRQAAYGKPFAPVAHYGDFVDDFMARTSEDRLSANEPYLLAMTRAYLRGDRVLKQAGAAIRAATWNVCVLSILPSWTLRPNMEPLSLLDQQNHDDLVDGLDQLAEEYDVPTYSQKKVTG